MARKWLDDLAENEVVKKRIEDILNHTGSSENGETLYVSNEQAAEVYALLFAAWSDGRDSLSDCAEHIAESEDGSAITGAQACRVEREAEEETMFAGATGTHLQISLT